MYTLERSPMALWPTLDDASASPQARAVFDDIRAARGTDQINEIWRVLANDPGLLERTWQQTKTTMSAGALDALTKELIYLAVSITNGCQYCIHTHSGAAKSKGMSAAQHAELLAVVGLANQMNRLVHGLAVPVPVDASPPPAASTV
jgi:AhpD family alkylhydroperoxidase